MKEPGTVNQGWRSFGRDVSERLPQGGLYTVGTTQNQRFQFDKNNTFVMTQN